MLDAAREASALVEGRSRADLDRDRPLALALLKLIEIVGEAADNVTEERRRTCPEIPWPKIVGMRHRLVHAYYDINNDVLWNTVTANLPPLVAALEKVVPPA